MQELERGGQRGDIACSKEVTEGGQQGCLLKHPQMSPESSLHPLARFGGVMPLQKKSLPSSSVPPHSYALTGRLVSRREMHFGPCREMEPYRSSSELSLSCGMEHSNL